MLREMEGGEIDSDTFGCQGGERFPMEECSMKGLGPMLVAALLLLTGCEKDRLDAQVKELCAKDGGIKVYETVKLPPEKFDKYGAVRIPSRRDAKPEDEYYYERDTTYLRTGNPSMWRGHHRIIRRSDGKLLGESIRYSRRGGDLPGPWHESSFGCPPIDKDQPQLESSIFLKN